MHRYILFITFFLPLLGFITTTAAPNCESYDLTSLCRQILFEIRAMWDLVIFLHPVALLEAEAYEEDGQKI